ncbi:ral guanine nucleotide dissociation stimulator-like isoform 2-T4 [Dugong dugon]
MNPPQKIHMKNSIIYSIHTKKAAPKGWHRLWCVCGSNQDLCETCVVRTFKAGSLEQLVEHPVPAFLEGDLSFIHVFLGTYRTFTTIQQVLYLLLQRYGFNFPPSARDGEPQEELKDAISFILNTWLDEYREDFDQPLYFPYLKLLMEYLQGWHQI